MLFSEKRCLQLKMSSAEKDIIEDLEKGAIDAHEAVQKKRDLEKGETEIHSDLDQEIATQRQELEKLKLGTLSNKGKWLDAKQATRLQRDLDQANDTPSKQQVLQAIQRRRDSFQTWGETLKQGDNVTLADGTRVDTIFTLDKSRGYDSHEYYSEMFIGLSESEQKKFLLEIKANIDERKQQFNTLLKLISPDTKDKELLILQKQTRKERTDYLALYAQHKELLDKLNTTPDQSKLLQAVFSEMGQRAKKAELDRLNEILKQPQYEKQFQSASKELQAKIQKQEGFSDFITLSISEQQRVIEAIKTLLRKEYKALSANDPNFNQADHKQFNSWADSDTWTFSDFEACIKYFPESIAIAAEVAQEAEKCSPDTLDFLQWDKLTAFDKHQLVKSGELHEEESSGLRQKYKNKLADYLPGKKHGKYGLLTTKAAKKYEDWFKTKNNQDQQNILEKGEKHDFLQKTLKLRVVTNKKFEALPKQYQTEYAKKYAQAGHEERLAMVKSIPELDKELTQSFTDKITSLIQDKLVSPKSLDAYLKWYKTLNIQEKTDHLLSSDLDNLERQVVLDTFENDIVPHASKSEAKKLKKEFYAADLDKRKQLISKWAEQYKLDTDLEELIEETQNSEESDIESDPKANPLLEGLSTLAITLKILLDTAKNFADQGKTKTALDLYNNWLEQANDNKEEISITEVKAVKAKIKDLKEENIDLENHDEIDQDPALNHHIDTLVDDLTTSDPKLQSNIEQYTVLVEMGQILHRNERLLDQKTAATRLRKTLQHEDIREIDDMLQSETDHQLSFQDGHYQVSQPNLIDLTTYGSNTDLEKQSKDYIVQQMETKAPIDRYDISFGVIHDGKELNADSFQERILNHKKTEIDNQLAQRIITQLQETHPQIDASKFVPQILATKQHRANLKAGKNLRAAA